MLTLVLRKMLNNKWMVACLLIGSILAVAIVSSIPIYTEGSLKGMLKKDMDKYYETNKIYPCSYNIETDFTYKFAGESSIKAYGIFDKKVTSDFANDIKLPETNKTKGLVIENLKIAADTPGDFNPSSGSINTEALSGFQKHIKIENGRMLSTGNTDGAYEAVVTEEAMKELDLRIGGVYKLSPINKSENDEFKIKVVGVFDAKKNSDPFWFKSMDKYNRSFFIDYSQFKGSLLKNYNVYLTKAQWNYTFDYHKISLSAMDSVVKAYNRHTRWFNANGRVGTLNIPAMEVFKDYSQRQKQLKITLWVLQIPILLMLAFYIFMVSRLIIDQEKNEIAILKSRGASSLQIFFSYLIESCLLSCIALAIGPFIGLWLCKVLGASNGFLEFVDRAPLPVSLIPKAYSYSFIAIAVFIATMMVPAFIASKTTIVQHKQRTGTTKSPLWKKTFVDFILLGIACWGLYSYNSRQHNLDVSKVKATDLSVDPLLFIISTLFILGAGLLVIRLFPYLVRLIFSIGKKKWSPVLYASFTQVGRSGGQEQFLMLFLILTLSIGFFNANASRTINDNMEDKIRYDVGADITIQPHWDDNAPLPTNGPPSVDDLKNMSNPVVYYEPKYEDFTGLKGVEKATKVFRNYNATVQIGNSWANNAEIMAVIPDEFSKIIYLRQDLLPYHINAYLNLLANQQSAILVSRSFEKKYGAKVGDHITFKWGDQNYVEGVIYAFVDYWPSFNPKVSVDGSADPNLIVANLSYIQALTRLEPYEIWIKKKPEKTIGEMSNNFNADIAKKGLKIVERKDTTQQIIKKKMDPMLESTNGALTMGFMLTMFISSIGFIIYWTLSIRRRILQFGIFRAMGLSFTKLIGIIICEQVLISGTAIFTGIIIGGITSDLFVPLLQIVYSSAEQVPPFIIIAKQIDYIRIYGIVTLMLLIGIFTLGRIISRMNINQAIKLGED